MRQSRNLILVALVAFVLLAPGAIDAGGIAPSQAKPDSLRLAVKGDFGSGLPEQAGLTRAMCEWRESRSFTLVLTTGDNFYAPDGTATESNYYGPERCLYAYPQHQWRASWGNHDHAGVSTREVLGSPQEPRYFSWTAGDVAFFAYDGTVVTEEQRQWLRHEVCSSTAPVKIIYGHQPPFSTGLHGSSVAVREMVHPVARDCGVTLVLSGHDHLYERSSAIEGVTYIVTGGGGHYLYECGTPEDWVVRCDSKTHFLYIVINKAMIRVQAVNADGVVFDVANIRHKKGK